jgi:fluoride exporter
MVPALAVALGGAVGSVARYAVSLAMARTVPHLALPYATFFVNVLGCLVIGLLSGLVASHRLELSVEARSFIFVGVLGGFTTFSTFGLDTLALVQSGLRGLAIWNVASQVGLGLLAVSLGFGLASR